MKSIALALALALAVPLANAAETPAPKELPKSTIEVFRIAPGQHEEFLNSIAHAERVAKRLGIQLDDLYIHDGGASWDFILVKRHGTDPAKWDEMIRILRSEGYPGGVDYFLWSRKMFAHHEDTTAIGPTTATEYLSTRLKPVKPAKQD